MKGGSKMTTEGEMRDLIVDALSESDDAAFGKIEPFIDIGMSGIAAGCVLWAPDGMAFQFTVLRDRGRDIIDSYEEELNGRISALTNGAIDPQHNAYLEGMRKGFESALVIYQAKRNTVGDY